MLLSLPSLIAFWHNLFLRIENGNEIYSTALHHTNPVSKVHQKLWVKLIIDWSQVHLFWTGWAWQLAWLSVFNFLPSFVMPCSTTQQPLSLLLDLSSEKKWLDIRVFLSCSSVVNGYKVVNETRLISATHWRVTLIHTILNRVYDKPQAKVCHAFVLISHH